MPLPSNDHPVHSPGPAAPEENENPAPSPAKFVATRTGFHERVNTSPTTPPVRGPDWHPAPFAPRATCSTAPTQKKWTQKKKEEKNQQAS